MLELEGLYTAAREHTKQRTSRGRCVSDVKRGWRQGGGGGQGRSAKKGKMVVLVSQKQIID